MSRLQTAKRTTRAKPTNLAGDLRKLVSASGFPKTDRWSAFEALLEVAERWKSAAKPERTAAAKLAEKLLAAAALTAGLTTRRPTLAERQSLATLLAEPFARPYRGIAAESWSVSVSASGKPKSAGQIFRAASAAVMRRSWMPDAAALGLEFGARGDALRLNLGGALIVAGDWRTTVAQDGVPLASADDWDVACWFADPDGEYLELNRALTGEVEHVRQLFVARHAPWVLLTDSVRGARKSEWALNWEIPAAAATGLQGLVGSRGQRVLGVSTEILAAPLSSPPDPMRPGPDRLALKNGAFTLEHRATGLRTLAAVGFTWGTNACSTANWRPLTITHDRTLSTTEEAFAVRMAAGGKQCVFFTSLEHPKRRAFLGHQTFDETVLGVFDSKGDVNPWLRVE